MLVFNLSANLVVHRLSAPAEDNDIMIIESDEEEGLSNRSSATVSSGTKRKHSDAEAGETSTKRPRTEKASAAAAPTDNDDDDIIALD